MALNNIKKPNIGYKSCPKCGSSFPIYEFTYTHSIFYNDNRLPICNRCITNFLKAQNFAWQTVDKLCQTADIPFIVREWERMRELNSDDTVWQTYASNFESQCYQEFGWQSYDKEYRSLREVGLLEEEIPLVREKKYAEMRRKWGENYDEESLNYLEDLYTGLTLTQNVSGALQIDQAKKLCKISLEIDSLIRAGGKDIDKLLGSYDKLVKTAEFTPKNAKNATDFDSIAEVFLWLEKRGNINQFYDGTTRDIIDETLKNIQAYNQRLYLNEGGIGESITQRLQALKSVQEAESTYNTQSEFDLDVYDNNGYKFPEEDEEFNLDFEDGVDGKN